MTEENEYTNHIIEVDEFMSFNIKIPTIMDIPTFQGFVAKVQSVAKLQSMDSFMGQMQLTDKSKGKIPSGRAGQPLYHFKLDAKKKYLKMWNEGHHEEVTKQMSAERGMQYLVGSAASSLRGFANTLCLPFRTMKGDWTKIENSATAHKGKVTRITEQEARAMQGTEPIPTTTPDNLGIISEPSGEVVDESEILAIIEPTAEEPKNDTEEIRLPND